MSRIGGNHAPINKSAKNADQWKKQSKMKTEINIWNGGGWNNYKALQTLKSLKVGCRGLAAKQKIAKIEVAPRDSERPFGIAARYYDADGELVFTQGFDQNDSADWIRERIHALLVEGVQNRIAARAAELGRAAFTKKISAWRRNFYATPPTSNSIDKLSVKFHAMRRAALDESNRPSRKLCTNLAREVAEGRVTFKDAVNQIVAAGGIVQ